jgi:hypothetical protein
MKNGGLSGLNPTGGSTTVVMGNTIRNLPPGYYGIDFTVDVGPYQANDIRVIGNYVQGQGTPFRFQNTSNDYTVNQHVDRIILANNWATCTSNIGVLVSGGSSPSQAMSIMIEGNWFDMNPAGVGFSAGPLALSAGKWVIIRNNFFTCQPIADSDLYSNIIVEGNTCTVATLNRYGGTPYPCAIDGQTVAAGATYSNTSGGLGYRTTDSVEICRAPDCSGGLIIWGVVTAANTITTYVYNPTAGPLTTGTGNKALVHRTIPV